MARNLADLHDRFVEWVYDHSGESPLGDVDFEEFSMEHGLTSTESWTLLRQCKDKGLLDNRYSTLGTPVANMTPEGCRYVEARKTLRADKTARPRNARNGLLRWLWARKQEGRRYPLVKDFLKTPESWFVGDHLSEDEIDMASASLAERGLIHGMRPAGRRGPVRAETTVAGDRCVEEYGGDVAEYERAQRAGGIHFGGDNNGAVFGGDNKGNINLGGHNPQQNVTNIESEKAAAEALKFVEQYRRLRSMLQAEADADAEAEVAQIVSELEEEANGSAPDPGRLRRGLERAAAVLNSPAIGGAIGNLLATGAQSAAAALT